MSTVVQAASGNAVAHWPRQARRRRLVIEAASLKPRLWHSMLTDATLGELGKRTGPQGFACLQVWTKFVSANHQHAFAQRMDASLVDVRE